MSKGYKVMFWNHFRVIFPGVIFLDDILLGDDVVIDKGRFVVTFFAVRFDCSSLMVSEMLFGLS